MSNTYRTPDLPGSLDEVWDLGGDRWVRVDDQEFVPEQYESQRDKWVDESVDWPELVAEHGPLRDVPPGYADPRED